MSVSDNNGVSLTNGSVMRAGAFDQPLPNANSPAPSSTHGYRTLIGERNHDTLNDRIVPHRSICSKLARSRGTEPVHMRNGKQSRVWTPAQTASECRLPVCERPSGSEPVKAIPKTQNNRKRRTSPPKTGTTYREGGHHHTRHLKVSLVFDHVGDTDTLKPAIRSSNVHRVQNESGKSAQPLIAITVALCGRARLINHCQTPTRPLRINAWLSHPDWRAQPRHAERSHRTAQMHLQQTCKHSRDRTCTHAQREAKSAWTPARITSEQQLPVCERPSGTEPVKAIPKTQTNRKRRTSPPKTGTTYREGGHHHTRHLKVSLVFDHVGDTDTRKPAIRSSNVHRAQNESGKSPQPLIAITVGITGPGE